MREKLKSLMDELALLFVKIVDTAVFTAVAETSVKVTQPTEGEPKNEVAEKVEAAVEVNTDSTPEEPVTAPQEVEVKAEEEPQKIKRRVFLKPCPVCGEENKRRAQSYLCKAHTSPENEAKFRGWTKATGSTEAAE